MLCLVLPEHGEIYESNCDPNGHRSLAVPAAAGVSKDQTQGFEIAAQLFRALGDVARLRLAAHLLTTERCVGELAELEGEALSTISQRLRILHGEKIVTRRRIGKHVSYALKDSHIAELVQNALIHASE